MEKEIEQDTVWEITFKALKDAGINVYPPSTKKGKCEKPYVVIKEAGGARFGLFSSEYIHYMFLVYVPRDMYDYLSVFERKIKDVLHKKCFPMLVPTGSKENDYYDDNYDAHMRSFTYRNVARNKYI